MAPPEMEVNKPGSVAPDEGFSMPARFRKARLNPPEASDYLSQIHGIQVARTTLAKKRCVGGGPVFEKFGRSVLYQRTALDDWALEQLSAPHATTSDY